MTDLFVKLSNTHHLSNSSSFHFYHCKKEIPNSQVLRLKRIYSNNEIFDKRCNDLERWLMEKI